MDACQGLATIWGKLAMNTVLGYPICPERADETHLPDTIDLATRFTTVPPVEAKLCPIEYNRIPPLDEFAKKQHHPRIQRAGY